MKGGGDFDDNRSDRTFAEEEKRGLEGLKKKGKIGDM